ncbi:MAG: ABC transporter ATP-binding protein [Thermoplasmata archaeon]|jgi:ABC-2 type transport system ATP-binding protein|nr:ABC transporter ATP-binding protein [Thermoplasmata archaeon]
MSAEPVIEVVELSKQYKDIRAVDGISLSIPSNQIFSMLGANGAGKTTTVEILEGLRSPTSGSARVFGVDVAKDYRPIRSRVGILPQNFEPFDMLKPTEAIEYWAGLFDKKVTRKDVSDLLETVNLSHRKDVVSKKLSGGEKRKLGIALSLINEPELLFLDEPTTGLDPRARRDLWALIEGIKKKGSTVFLTTHYLDEAEKLSDDVAIMHKGRIITRGSPEDLVRKHGKLTVIVLAGAGEVGLKEVTRRGIDATLESDGDLLVPVRDPTEMRQIFQKLSGIELKVKDMYTRKQTLEDVFLSVVGQKMDEGVLGK